VQGGIGTAIVDDDDFKRLIRQRHADFLKQGLEVVRFVLRGDQYRYKNVIAHRGALLPCSFVFKGEWFITDKTGDTTSQTPRRRCQPAPAD
jgi:hypothetical protein